MAGVLSGTRPMRLARFLGAPIYITWSWLLFVAIIVPLYTRRLESWFGTGQAIALSLALALMWGLSVLLHELGHVAAARANGCRVERVEIGFLGGATTVVGEDDSPGREFAIAAAGPAVSLALGVPGGIGMLTGNVTNLGFSGVPGLFISAITLANLAIAAFNLLPGLPLDGGRVAVAILWRVTGNRQRATVIASYVGQLIAAAVAVYAVSRVIGAAQPAREIPWVLALAVMSASLWSMAHRAREVAVREGELAGSPLADHLTPVDVLDGSWPASALHDAATPLVLVRSPDGLAYADRTVATATRVIDAARPLAAHRILPESASRLDLLNAIRSHDDPWYVVVAADGTPLGIVGASALADR